MTVSYLNTANPATIAHSGETLGDQSTRSGTLELVFTPIDNLKIKAFGTMWEDDDGPSAQATLYGNTQGNCYGTYICGVLNQNPLIQPGANTKIDQYIANFLRQSGRQDQQSAAAQRYGRSLRPAPRRLSPSFEW